MVKTEPPSAMKETVMDSSLEQDQAKRKPSRSSKSKPVNMSFVLNPKEQLDSDIITEGLNLISKQYPDVITQDCLLIQRQKCFEPALQFNHGDFCQVLHMRGANHWVSVTNIAAKDSDVRYFDSLGLTPTLKICQAIASKKRFCSMFKIKKWEFFCTKLLTRGLLLILVSSLGCISPTVATVPAVEFFLRRNESRGNITIMVLVFRIASLCDLPYTQNWVISTYFRYVK